MKFCNVCGIEKSIDDFCINKSKKDGRNTICKDCVKIKNNIYYKNNRNKSLEYQKNYIKNNKDKIKEYQENYYQDNRKNLLEETKVRSKIYYENNKENYKEIHHKYYENNKEQMLEKRKEYIENNIDKVRDYRKTYSTEYKQKNKEKLKELKKNWERRNKHIIIWRSLLKRTLRKFDNKKTDSTYDMIGYNSNQLKSHLENLFTDGMNWSNYGEWQVDHIKPLYTFDKNTPPSIVNSLSNLRPLWMLNKEINDLIYEGNLNRKRKFEYEEI